MTSTVQSVDEAEAVDEGTGVAPEPLALDDGVALAADVALDEADGDGSAGAFGAEY
ncbi:MAG: hypothetical protein ACHREM_07245 [Polyangiales bacterium]